jgi:hypothetical protein
VGEHANSGRGEEEGISVCVLDCPPDRCCHTKGQIIEYSNRIYVTWMVGQIHGDIRIEKYVIW